MTDVPSGSFDDRSGAAPRDGDGHAGLDGWIPRGGDGHVPRGGCAWYDTVPGQGVVGREALSSARGGVPSRDRNGQLSVTDGPFVETKEQLGGGA